MTDPLSDGLTGRVKLVEHRQGIFSGGPVRYVLHVEERRTSYVPGGDGQEPVTIWRPANSTDLGAASADIFKPFNEVRDTTAAVRQTGKPAALDAPYGRQFGFADFNETTLKKVADGLGLDVEAVKAEMTRDADAEQRYPLFYIDTKGAVAVEELPPGTSEECAGFLRDAGKVRAVYADAQAAPCPEHGWHVWTMLDVPGVPDGELGEAKNFYAAWRDAAEFVRAHLSAVDLSDLRFAINHHNNELAIRPDTPWKEARKARWDQLVRHGFLKLIAIGDVEQLPGMPTIPVYTYRLTLPGRQIVENESAAEPKKAETKPDATWPPRRPVWQFRTWLPEPDFTYGLTSTGQRDCRYVRERYKSAVCIAAPCIAPDAYIVVYEKKNGKKGTQRFVLGAAGSSDDAWAAAREWIESGSAPKP